MDKLRTKYQKGEDVRYISHLDVLRAFQRALRRAEVPFVLTEGFNPKPKMNFSPPLSLGYVSRAEYFDVDVTDMMPEEFAERMNSVLPSDLKVLDVTRIDCSSKSLNSIIQSSVYKIIYPFGSDIFHKADEFLDGDIVIEKRTKKGLKTMDIKPFIYDLVIKDKNTFEVWLPSGSAQSINPMYVLRAYLDFAGREFRIEAASIMREEQYIDKVKHTPMEAGAFV